MAVCTGAPPAQRLPSGCGGNMNDVDWTRGRFVVSSSSTPQKYSCEGGVRSAPFAVYQDSCHFLKHPAPPSSPLSYSLCSFMRRYMTSTSLSN